MERLLRFFVLGCETGIDPVLSYFTPLSAVLKGIIVVVLRKPAKFITDMIHIDCQLAKKCNTRLFSSILNATAG